MKNEYNKVINALNIIDKQAENGNSDYDEQAENGNSDYDEQAENGNSDYDEQIKRGKAYEIVINFINKYGKR